MADGSRPNVVFIVGDNVGWGDIGALAQSAARYPHIKPVRSLLDISELDGSANRPVRQDSGPGNLGIQKDQDEYRDVSAAQHALVESALGEAHG
jgi:hypothetical protein